MLERRRGGSWKAPHGNRALALITIRVEEPTEEPEEEANTGNEPDAPLEGDTEDPTIPTKERSTTTTHCSRGMVGWFRVRTRVAGALVDRQARSVSWCSCSGSRPGDGVIASEPASVSRLGDPRTTVPAARSYQASALASRTTFTALPPSTERTFKSGVVVAYVGARMVSPWRVTANGGGPHLSMFRFVVLPDFQAYCDIRLQITQALFKIEDQRDMMFRQVDWVKAHAAELNVQMVFQEGDLTQTNYPEEWALSEMALARLDDVVPYQLCVGNHDMGYEKHPPPGRFWVSNRRDSLVSEYFPPERFTKNPLYTYGGNLDGKSENYFLLFEVETLRFLSLSLEFMPRDEAIAWANDVIAGHPDRRIIILTHGFLDARARRDLRGEMYPIEGNTAEDLWHKLVSRHPNVFLVLSGHDYGEARRTDLGIHGNVVHQLMANYQWWENGGMGWLRLLEFHPGLDRIDVRTYSPVLGRFRRAPSSEFSLRYVMSKDPATLPNLSRLQMRKLRHFFSLFDADDNGVIEMSDFLALRDRLANMRGFDIDDPVYTMMGESLTRIWRVHVGPDASQRLSMGEFLEHWSANLTAIVKGGHAANIVFTEIDTLVDMCLDVLDANRDGTIGCIEFLLFLKALGVDHGQISTFKRLDRDADGEITREEMRLHAREYFLGNDEHSLSNHLFGDLRRLS